MDNDSLVNAVAFSPDGKRLASGNGGVMPGDNAVKLWDTVTGKLLATWKH